MTNEECSMCGSKIELIPKAGSGTETHWVCKTCVEKMDIDVLPEYLENITQFGHWHRPLYQERRRMGEHIMGKYSVVHHDPDMNEKGDIVYLLQSIANKLASSVKLEKIELKHSIRFNLTEQEKKEIDEA